MKKLANWRVVNWFYHNGVFVSISKSEKGRYRSEIFGNNMWHILCPFITKQGAKKAAIELITEDKMNPTGDWDNE